MRILVNGESREIEPGTTVADLLQALGLSRFPLAVERNHDVVDATALASTVLQADDALEIVTFVGGG